MIRRVMKVAGAAAGLALALSAGALAQQAVPTGPGFQPSPVLLPEKPEIEPKAMAILKGASDRLAAASAMSFTAVATYESPARTMQPLAYMVRLRVTMQRPDKLRVISDADGPLTEFYYDGRQMIGYEPASDLAAVADAPATIDEMLKVAYEKAAISFPFDDVISSNPGSGLGPDLKLAFYIGQSRIVGDTVTDIVCIANGQAQAQIWIGAEDRLPRMIRVVYFNEPGHYRHTVAFHDWKLDPAIPAGTFVSERALKARRIRFAAPDVQPGQK
jgi:hypothetical protein